MFLTKKHLYEKELDFLEKLELTYEKYKHQLDEYDKVNIFLLSKFIINNERVYQVIFHPTGISLLFIASIVVPIMMLKNDIKEALKNITELLKPGDKVKLDGCLGEYLGIKNITSDALGNQQQLSIRFSNIDMYIPIERAWRLYKYEGSAKRLNKYIYRPNTKLAKAKDYLCELLDLDETDIPPVVKSKTLIVCDRHIVLNNLTKLFFGKIPFTNVLPSGYFKNKDDFERIGTDPLQRRPVVCFTGNMGVAQEIIEQDPDIKSVIIYGTRKLKGYYVFLSEMQRKLLNITILSDIKDVDLEATENLLSQSFELYSWTPDQIKSLSIEESNPIIDNQFARGRKILQSLANSNCTIVETEPQEDSIIEEIKSRLEKLRKAHFESEFKIPFISKSYAILTYLRSMPIPLNEQQELFYNTTLLELEELRIQMFTAVNIETFKDFEFVITNLKGLLKYHREFHPKNQSFLDLVSKLKQNDCIVVSRNNQKEAMKEWLRDNFFRIQPHVLSLNEFSNSKRFFRKAVFPGWYGDKHTRLFFSSCSDEQHMILYPFELRWYKASKDRFSHYIDKNSRNKILNNLQYEPEPEYDEADLETYIARAFEPNGYLINSGNKVQNGEASPTAEAYFVEFEEDYVAFLLEGYNCRCLSSEEEDVTKKKVTELNTQDTLIFIKDSSEDIFEKLVETVVDSDSEIKGQVLLSGLWRISLKEYKDNNCYNYENIRKLLEMQGVSRVTATIKSWIQDDSYIGPGDDAIRAIAEMTGHRELMDKLEEVIIACKRIRSLHIQLGRYLAQSVISSFTADSISQTDKMLQKISDDLSEYAQTVSVKRVSKEKFTVPIGKINRLLDK